MQFDMRLSCGARRPCVMLLALSLGFLVLTSSGEARRFKRGNGKCTEESLAMYKLTFYGYWAKKTFPKMYPRYRPNAQWSKLIGRTHNSHYHLWSLGSLATPAVQRFVEEGDSVLLDQEAQGYNGSFDAFTAAPIRGGVGRTSVRILADGVHSKVSLMVKLVPSPDWFVGVNGFELCRRGRWKRRLHVNLRPLDAGTDKGLTYTSPNWPAVPQEDIFEIKPYYPRHPASSFYYPNSKKLPRIARVVFEKVVEYSKRGVKSVRLETTPNVVVVRQEHEIEEEKLQRLGELPGDYSPSHRASSRKKTWPVMADQLQNKQGSLQKDQSTQKQAGALALDTKQTVKVEGPKMVHASRQTSVLKSSPIPQRSDNQEQSSQNIGPSPRIRSFQDTRDSEHHRLSSSQEIQGTVSSSTELPPLTALFSEEDSDPEDKLPGNNMIQLTSHGDLETTPSDQSWMHRPLTAENTVTDHLDPSSMVTSENLVLESTDNEDMHTTDIDRLTDSRDHTTAFDYRAFDYLTSDIQTPAQKLDGRRIVRLDIAERPVPTHHPVRPSIVEPTEPVNHYGRINMNQFSGIREVDSRQVPYRLSTDTDTQESYDRDNVASEGDTSYRKMSSLDSDDSVDTSDRDGKVLRDSGEVPGISDNAHGHWLRPENGHSTAPVDCVVTKWGEWSPCSKTCGFGIRKRERHIRQHPKHGGQLCPRLEAESLCGSMRNCRWNYFSSVFRRRSRRRRHHHRE